MSENVQEEQLCRPQDQCRRRAGGAPGTGAEVPCSPWSRPRWRQAVPAAMEAHGGADPHLQPREDPTLTQGVPEGGCDPVGSPHWSRLLVGAVALQREEPMLEQVCWQGLWPHGWLLEQFMDQCLPWESWSRGRGGRSGRDIVWWPDHNPHSLFPCTVRGGGGREIGSEVEPGKKGGVGRRWCKICFYFSLTYSDFIGNRLN